MHLAGPDAYGTGSNARIRRLASSQARSRGGLGRKEITVGSSYEGANVHNPQELLKIAQHHCQAILTIIDQLTENKSNTELRLLSQRLQRLAFQAAPRSRD